MISTKISLQALLIIIGAWTYVHGEVYGTCPTSSISQTGMYLIDYLRIYYESPYLISSSYSQDIPSTGFIQTVVYSPDENRVSPLVLHVKSRKFSQKAPLCGHITIENQPSPNASPLMGPNHFTLLPELYNDHFAWSNGPEVISFIPHSDRGGKYGNWLLGNTPGVDSGYVYRTTSASHLSPASVTPPDDASSTEESWHWLLNQQWRPQTQMYIRCVSGDSDIDDEADEFEDRLTDFFEVEYFSASEDEGAVELQTGVLFPSLPSVLDEHLRTSPIDCSDSVAMHLWDSSAALFLTVYVQHVIAAVGDPVQIASASSLSLSSDAAQQFAGSIVQDANKKPNKDKAEPSLDADNPDNTELGVLLGAELASSRSWRLFFHMLPLYPPPLSSPKNASAPQRTNGYYRIDEKYVELTRTGDMLNSVKIIVRSSKAGERQREKRAQFERDVLLYATQPGDYLWVWESKLVRDNDNENNNDNSITEDKIEEVLLRCTQRRHHEASGQVVLSFASFPAHRQVQMTQRIAQRVVHHYTVSVSLPTDNQQQASSVTVLQHGFGASQENVRHVQTKTPVRWSSLVSLSHRPLTYITEHLRWKEHKVGHALSSCFLYHAAITLPAPFIYAAEILCVLLGSKPVAMIQLSSPSEHQWKFPLVTELAKAVVETTDLYNLVGNASSSSFPVDYAVFTYGEDETLVLYRKNRRYLMETLLPRFTAQALHPMPFPSHHNHDPGTFVC